MMTEFRRRSVDTEKIGLSNSSAVTHFCINNRNFLVIPLAPSTEENYIGSLDAMEENSSLSNLGYFEFSGRRYIIVIDQNSSQTEELDIVSLLTERELQIASLVAIGWSNKQVANHLHISEWTVSAHLRRIFIKIQVDSRAAMVYRCAPFINQLHQFQRFNCENKSSDSRE